MIILKKHISIFSSIAILLMTILVYCCISTEEKKITYQSEEKKELKESKEQTFEELYDSASQSIPVFYNMYLTVEMSSIFEETGVTFNSEILNPSENIDNYLTSYKKALNIGIYAVDLSYVKVFEEFDYAGSYFSAMHKLSENLGIPDDFFYDAAKRFEKNITNKDSLAFIANEIYTITDNYLKENNRENTASLIIIGGWIEAIYLAINIYNNSRQSKSILEKIADQKHSLKQVADLVDLSKDNNDYIVSIINDIKSMQEWFDKLAEKTSNKTEAEQILAELYSRINNIRKDITK